MEKLPYAESFRDLFAYQKAQELAICIFDISHDFPSHELYSLTQQIRRSSRSIGAQISEAWAKRRYKKHFVSKLTDALAELNETEHWIATAAQCGYVSPKAARELNADCSQLGHLLGEMIAKADHFCKDT